MTEETTGDEIRKFRILRVRRVIWLSNAFLLCNVATHIIDGAVLIWRDVINTLRARVQERYFLVGEIRGTTCGEDMGWDFHCFVEMGVQLHTPETSAAQELLNRNKIAAATTLPIHSKLALQFVWLKFSQKHIREPMVSEEISGEGNNPSQSLTECLFGLSG